MQKERPIVIPIASGKGGVGKTFVSVNISYALAELGKKTVLLDLDFGGANIHTCMGYDTAPDGVGNFLNQRNMKLPDYLLTTTNDNLKFIPGDAEMVGIANISAAQKRKLINQIMNLDADYVVLDLGAGSTYNTIDFFMMSSFGVIVATPEITSILNAYALLKNSIFRLLFVGLKKYPEAKEVFTGLMKKGGESAWKINELLDMLFEIDPEIHAETATIIDTFNPKIIINMANKPQDLAMGEKLRKISKNYLNIEMEYIGFLYRDKIVERSIEERKPLYQIAPDSQTYQTVVRMAYKIVNAKKMPYFLLDIDSYDESLEILMEEATDDLATKIDGYNELADENLISINELLSIVKNLEYENISLKRKIEELEQALLKVKR
ncbi:MAG TPA: P-loop NTPase [Spirochaetota bacterium]|jgi:flagellar biosynthesis protein FlhG|nr:MAG: Flagellum site-determining protein YlxH [Spirochaetes bacterium ADurb.Bin133]HNZ27086.1 P-loop NTPase [Spirochaetota bacterium]HOF01597.1 P-loop NTPase [Spirochaetota bacterium]HOS32910.1 P-loop NTPase [Spirochaetota bacterium]HOS56096.1 P-loop NTPase [Spirochaetota bacterium]